MKTIFTLVMAFVFIILGFATMGNEHAIVYPLRPSDLLLMEFIGIGVPSFFLALQPDKSQIKGHFLSNTFSKAIPGAICLLAVAATTLIMAQNGFFDLQGDVWEIMPWFTSATDHSVASLMGLGMMFASLSMLFALCIPFDAYRTCLVIGNVIIALIVVFGIVPLPFFRSIVTSNYTDFASNKIMVLMCVIFALATPLFTTGLMKLFAWFNNSGKTSPRELQFK